MPSALSRSATATRVLRAITAHNPDFAVWMRAQRRVATELRFATHWRSWYAPRIRAILDS